MTARSRAFAAAAALLAVSAFALVWRTYAGDLTAARQRVAGGSALAHTPCGPIEYAAHGSGPALLVVHGAGGGWDQGLAIAQGLPGRGLRVIAMSRFGYLRTPLPADASAPAQADAHACLLDALGIERAAVLGASAGAPSALQFALRHPARTRALVLMVPAAHLPGDAGGTASPRATAWLFDTALRSDFAFWALVRTAPDTAIRWLLATPPALVHASGTDERRRVDAMLGLILPVSARRLGLLNDARVVSTLAAWPLARIEAPALVVSARDDLFDTYRRAEWTASQLPHARFVGHDSGGHLLVGRQRETTDEIAALVRSATP